MHNGCPCTQMATTKYTTPPSVPSWVIVDNNNNTLFRGNNWEYLLTKLHETDFKDFWRRGFFFFFFLHDKLVLTPCWRNRVFISGCFWKFWKFQQKWLENPDEASNDEKNFTIPLQIIYDILRKHQKHKVPPSTTNKILERGTEGMFSISQHTVLHYQLQC